MLRSLPPAVALLACAGPGPGAGPSPAAPPASVDRVDRADRVDLGWLVGTWRAESEGQVTVERWTILADGSLAGENATYRADRRVHSEVLAITTEPRAVAFRATPSGQPPHTFPLMEVGPRRVVFADPTHDWPQYIQYEREGERLIAKVWGESDDDPRLAVWSFVLAP